MNLVAVYGTLRKGFGNYNYLLRNTSEEEILPNGTNEIRIPYFNMYSLGGFPYAKPSENKEDEITCELYRVDDDVLESLDSLEGYPSFYDRKKIPTPVGDAYIYFIDSDKYGAPSVESGDWKEFVLSQHAEID